MCTVTWLRNDGGFHLFCNRDEKVNRSAAIGPEIHAGEGVRFVAPRDPDGGGTWIGVNEFGVAVCLLNAYGRHRQCRSGRPSRGRLAWRALPKLSAFASILSIADQRLDEYQPFTALALDPHDNAWMLCWDGDRKLVTPASDELLPYTSSSFDGAGVARFRRDELKRSLVYDGGLSVAALLAFHWSHGNGQSPDAYTPCMHRPGARTVSFTQITVTRTKIRFWYHPAAPCESADSEALQLPRAVSLQ